MNARRASLAVAAVLAAAPVRAESDRVNLHVEIGPAFLLNAPQSTYFKPGFDGSLKGDVKIAGPLALQLSLGMLDFAPAGPAFTDHARAFWGGGGARLRLFDSHSGYALHAGSGEHHQGRLFSALWLDAGAQLVWSGGLLRPGVEVGLGVDLAVIDGLQVAPFVRFMHVRQDAPGLDPSDVSMLFAGFSLTPSLPGSGLHPAPPPPPATEVEVVDADGDGLPDGDDRCPQQPGAREDEGCPDIDSDKDGVADWKDTCPQMAGLQPSGCPEMDSDEDGIADSKDPCPDRAEVFNGFEDDDGCPDKGAPLVIVTRDQIEVKQALKLDPVRFGSAQWMVNRESYLLLATLAKVLTLHPEIRRVRVEGHTDGVGTRDYNILLSRRRAETVMQHLIEVNGIDPARLVSEGFGFERPIAGNGDERGRAKNRRVEFRITDRIQVTQRIVFVSGRQVLQQVAQEGER